MLELTLYDLKPHQLKADHTKRNSKNSLWELNGMISITKTVQGKEANIGININIHEGSLIGYPFVNLYAIGNRLYLVPTFSEIESYSLSINPTSKCLYAKVGSSDNCNILLKFLGKHKATTALMGDQKVVFVEI